MNDNCDGVGNGCCSIVMIRRLFKHTAVAVILFTTSRAYEMKRKREINAENERGKMGKFSQGDASNDGCFWMVIQQTVRNGE